MCSAHVCRACSGVDLVIPKCLKPQSWGGQNLTTGKQCVAGEWHSWASHGKSRGRGCTVHANPSQVALVWPHMWSAHPWETTPHAAAPRPYSTSARCLLASTRPTLPRSFSSALAPLPSRVGARVGLKRRVVVHRHLLAVPRGARQQGGADFSFCFGCAHSPHPYPPPTPAPSGHWACARGAVCGRVCACACVCVGDDEVGARPPL